MKYKLHDYVKLKDGREGTILIATDEGYLIFFDDIKDEKDIEEEEIERKLC